MNVQNLKPRACYGNIVVDEESALHCLKDMIRFFGLAFHPDNSAEEYIDVVTKERTFLNFEIEFYNGNLMKLCDILEDPYTEAIKMWHEAGMIDNNQYDNLMGEKDMNHVVYHDELIR